LKRAPIGGVSWGHDGNLPEVSAPLPILDWPQTAVMASITKTRRLD